MSLTTTTSSTPQTLLEAVNELLSAVRLSGVMTLLSADLNEDAAEAKRALDDASLEVQQKGWHFNPEAATLPATTSGEVYLPENTLRIRTALRPGDAAFVQRGSRLYCPARRTYAIGRAVSAQLTVALPFEELPSAARVYITALAARRFALPRHPSSTTFRYTEEALQAALVNMEHEEAEVGGGCLAETSPHFFAMSRR